MTNATPETAQPNRNAGVRLYLLDVLRLSAAISVVFYHLVSARAAGWDLTSKSAMEPLVAVASYGALGVQFFFMVSGFVILMSLWGRSLASFTASRISRLFPAYWVAVLLCSFLFLVIAPGEFKDLTGSQILVNLTMLQEPLGVAHIDGVYWTLWVELLFYITAALLATRGLTAERVLAFAFLWPLAGAMAMNAKHELLTQLLIPEYAPFFALGMVLYLIFAEGSTVLRWLVVSMNFVMGGFMATKQFLPTMERVTGRDLSTAVVWGILAVGVILIVLATVSPLKGRGFAWMSVAGALTYPLYLVHEYWGWWIIRTLSGSLNVWLVLALALIVVTVLAWAIYRMVEVPFSRKFRRLLEKSLPSRREKTAELERASNLTVSS